jgi:hypothetical protein
MICAAIDNKPKLTVCPPALTTVHGPMRKVRHVPLDGERWTVSGPAADTENRMIQHRHCPPLAGSGTRAHILVRTERRRRPAAVRWFALLELHETRQSRQLDANPRNDCRQGLRSLYPMLGAGAVTPSKGERQ